MEKTGVFFEMTETFTLENMFAMELHSHTEVLNEIVTAAVKEVAIEKVGKGSRGSRCCGSASEAFISLWFIEMGFYHVDEAGFELMISLPHLLECWDHRKAPAKTVFSLSRKHSVSSV